MEKSWNLKVQKEHEPWFMPGNIWHCETSRDNDLALTLYRCQWVAVVPFVIFFSGAVDLCASTWTYHSCFTMSEKIQQLASTCLPLIFITLSYHLVTIFLYKVRFVKHNWCDVGKTKRMESRPHCWIWSWLSHVTICIDVSEDLQCIQRFTKV